MAQKNIRTAITTRLQQLANRLHEQDDAAVRRITQKCRLSMQNALSLSDEDVGIKYAFELSGLDHRNIYHWRMLFEILADECLASGRPGRSKKWTPKEW